jgi:hypothetical protein
MRRLVLSYRRTLEYLFFLSGNSWKQPRYHQTKFEESNTALFTGYSSQYLMNEIKKEMKIEMKIELYTIKKYNSIFTSATLLKQHRISY